MVAPSKLLLIGPTAFRTFRNVWMLEELGVPYDHLATAAPWSKEAKEHHPMGKVPSLVATYDNDHTTTEKLVLYESAAINTFLGDAFANDEGMVSPSSSLLVPPPRTRQRALYDQTVHCVMAEMDAQALWIHRKHESLGRVFGKSEEAVAEARKQFRRANDSLARQLNPYLLGKDFTAADILYVRCLDWAKSIGWEEEWNNNQEEESNHYTKDLHKYIDMCHSRPAYQRAVERRNQERANRKKSNM